MIFLTGDVHIPYDISKLSTKNFKQQKHLKKTDYLIILGDFGLVWSEGSKEDLYWLKWFKNKTFTTLFIDGNHENHDLLDNLETVEKFGGLVGKLADNVYHLKRGEIYTIGGKTFYTFGGAYSVDRHTRVEGKDWWSREEGSREEQEYGVSKLESVGWNVDYVLTHAAPREVAQMLLYGEYTEPTTTHSYLNFIMNYINCDKWFFGHYHLDRELNIQGVNINEFVCLYHNIVRLV